MRVRLPLLVSLAVSLAAAGQEAPTREHTAQASAVRRGGKHSPATLGNRYDSPANVRRAPGATGSLGLSHVLSADLGEAEVLRFALLGEYFTKRDFPVTGASNTRTAGTFAISLVPTSFLELYLSYSASANTNTTSTPQLTRALGDVGFGAKLAHGFGHGFYAGVDLRAQTFSAVGNPDLTRFAFGFSPRAIATYDFREVLPALPLRLHANAGVLIDGSRLTAADQRVLSAEQFALGLNAYHRFAAGAGVELPLPVVTPFVEYNLAVPLGVSGQLLGPDGSAVPLSAAMPQSLGVGLKVTAVRDLTLGLSADIGLTRRVAAGIPAVPPFNVMLGAAFAVEPFRRDESVRVEKWTQVAPPEPTTGKIAGTVLDAHSGKPIPGVIVAMVGTGLPPVASDMESGRFLTHELASGTVKLSAQKPGYRPVEKEVTLVAGKTESVELKLEQEERRATFMINAMAKRSPVHAKVELQGPEPQQIELTESQRDALRVEAKPGNYEVSVTAPGYLSQTREVQLSEGAEMPLTFDLQPEPKKWLVVVKENKIDILQQVHFAPGKATILADSGPLLAQVVHAIVKNDLKRIRIEGHTDNKGSRAKNLQLSEDRAKAVVDYLASAGVDRSRLEPAGFGDSRPIAPNLTARGRELNRRVEFMILER